MFDGMVSGSFFGEFSDMGKGKNVCLDFLRVCLSVWVFCESIAKRFENKYYVYSILP